jgi:hypothetical protein
MPAYQYKDYERLYESRHSKRKDYRLIFRSCHLRKEGDNFAIRHRYEEELVFTISPTNWVTLHSEGASMTMRNLLSLAIDRTPIYSCRAGHKNKVHTIRLHANGKSNPYAPGIQVKLHHGTPIKFTNFPVDMTRAVTNEAKSAVKDETSKIRKLTRVMARMGVFDGIASRALTGWGRIGQEAQRDISKINYNDPVGDDAEHLFRFGLSCCDTPNHSEHVNGVWTRIDGARRTEIYRDRAVEAGLRALRKHIYSTKEGSYVHIPVRDKAHRQVP